MPQQKPEPMTSAEKAQLEADLAELEGPRRKAIVEAIAAARGFGDLSENFEYHAARNEQGLLERRIVVLRDRLLRAVIVDEGKREPGKIDIGSKVVIEDESGQRLAIDISSVGGVSPESPLGRALIGAHQGDDVEVEAPAGSWRARVLQVS